MDMVYVGEGTFDTSFKNNSLPGYYDKIGPSVYLRRDLSLPDRQQIYCYKMSGRWCIGPQAGSTEGEGFTKKIGNIYVDSFFIRVWARNFGIGPGCTKNKN